MRGDLYLPPHLLTYLPINLPTYLPTYLPRALEVWRAHLEKVFGPPTATSGLLDGR